MKKSNLGLMIMLLALCCISCSAQSSSAESSSVQSSSVQSSSTRPSSAESSPVQSSSVQSSSVQSSSVQSSYEFMGIPIKGDIHAFAKKLENKGFTKIPCRFTAEQINDGFILDYALTGTFFEIPNTRIELAAIPGTNNICKVAVGFVNLTPIEKLTVYDNIRNALIKKYPEGKEYIHDYTKDVEQLTYNDVYNALDNGRMYVFGICKKNDVANNKDSYYVSVIISKGAVILFYQNATLIHELRTAEQERRNADL